MIFVRVRNRGTLPWLYLHAGHHDCMSKLQTAERDAQEGLVRLRCKAECFFQATSFVVCCYCTAQYTCSSSSCPVVRNIRSPPCWSVSMCVILVRGCWRWFACTRWSANSTKWHHVITEHRWAGATVRSLSRPASRSSALHPTQGGWITEAKMDLEGEVNCKGKDICRSLYITCV